jgi:hypothetical protein
MKKCHTLAQILPRVRLGHVGYSWRVSLLEHCFTECFLFLFAHFLFDNLILTRRYLRCLGQPNDRVARVKGLVAGTRWGFASELHCTLFNSTFLFKISHLLQRIKSSFAATATDG